MYRTCECSAKLETKDTINKNIFPEFILVIRVRILTQFNVKVIYYLMPNTSLVF